MKERNVILNRKERKKEGGKRRNSSKERKRGRQPLPSFKCDFTFISDSIVILIIVTAIREWKWETQILMQTWNLTLNLNIRNMSLWLQSQITNGYFCPKEMTFSFWIHLGTITKLCRANIGSEQRLSDNSWRSWREIQLIQQSNQKNISQSDVQIQI